jgi:hypothetical protein
VLVKLSNHELEVLKQFETAALLRDLEHFPGWQIYKDLAAAKIQAVRDKYEYTAMDKDATWAAKLNLQALREFQSSMEELVSQAKDLLDPEAMKMLVESATEETRDE